MIPILFNGNRQIYPLARSHTDSGHYYGYGCRCIFTHWVSRYGAPTVIITDRGSQFDSQLFNASSNMIGAKRHRTTAYHLQSNGAAERWHRSFKTAIKCHETNDWTKVLPVVMLGLRNALKDDIGTSAAELVYGTQLRLPGEYFIQEEPSQDQFPFLEHLRKSMRNIRPQQTAHHNKPRIFIHKAMQTCTHVFVRVDSVKRLLDQPYEGPFFILERVNHFCYRLDIRGQPTAVSIDRLKPAFLKICSSEVPQPRTYSRNQQSITIQDNVKIIQKRVCFVI